MFKLLKNRTIRKKVEITPPVSDGEQPIKVEIFATFKIQPKSVKKTRASAAEGLIRRFNDTLRGNTPAPGSDITDTDLELQWLREDVINLDGIADEDGNAVPFSSDVFDQVMEESYARSRIAEVWKDIQNDAAWAEAQKKN